MATILTFSAVQVFDLQPCFKWFFSWMGVQLGCVLSKCVTSFVSKGDKPTGVKIRNRTAGMVPLNHFRKSVQQLFLAT